MYQEDVQALLADSMSVILTVDDQGTYDNEANHITVHTSHRGLLPGKQKSSKAKAKQSPPQETSSYFSKSWLYPNSRLPPHLLPIQLYIPTWPLLCLASRQSLAVYEDKSVAAVQRGSVNLAIPASVRHATKAMTITTTAHDTTSHIILAIRGTSTFIDWATNANPTPKPPTDFLPDQGNLVHAGFLHVARSMVHSIAAQLRTLLEERPERCAHSLCLTGHSAGGAVAALLYAHIVSLNTGISSELKSVASAFRRVHCVTFGAPPVSLLPLLKPNIDRQARSEEVKRLRKSVFLGFVNEGDPVVRADVGIAKSLLCLYTAPVPPPGFAMPWPIPPGTLSCAGTLVLLRGPSPSISGSATLHSKGTNSYNDNERKKKSTRTALTALLKGSSSHAAQPAPSAGYGHGITASMISDSQLRDVVFGDPVLHAMKIYKERVEALAFTAVTASNGAV